MKKIIATIVALVFSTSAYAAEIGQISIGATLNHGVYVGDGKEENYTHTGTLETTSKKDGAAFVDTYATIFVEAEVNDNMSIGISYAPDTVDTPQNVNDGEGGDGQTDIKVQASFEDLTTIYALAKSDNGLFAKLGYSMMDINLTTENAGTYGNTDTDGFELALGYEHDLGTVGVRAELAYQSFSSVNANNGQTDKNEVTVSNMQGATARISLVKSF